MVGTGSSNSGLINGDDSTVGVGHKVGVQVEGTTVAVGNRGSMGVNSTNSDGTSNDRSSSNGGSSHNGSSGSEGSSLGGEVVGTGSSHSRFVNGDDGAVGVGDKVGVQVERAGVAVARSVGTSVADSGNRSNGSNGSSSGNDRGSSDDGSSSSESSSLGGEVVSTGSGDGRLINRDNSTVGVGDKVGVQVEGTSVAVSRGVGGGSSVANGSNRGGMGDRDSSNGGSSHKRSSSELGGEMVSLQGGHTGLVDGGDGTVGVALQTEEALGGGEGETGGENLKENFDSLFTLSVTLTHQKLHGVFGCVLELKLRRVELK